MRSDVMFLISLIQNAARLMARMREDGREELTGDELASLGVGDDAARERLVEAIEKAIAESR